MKTKLKNALINTATDCKKFKKFCIKLFIFWIIYGCFAMSFGKPHWCVLAFVSLIPIQVLKAIEQNKLILDRNKLSDIIFSKRDVWYYILMFFIGYPLILVLFYSAGTDSVAAVISIAICCGFAFLTMNLSTIFSKHFYNKLKKIEPML